MIIFIQYKQLNHNINPLFYFSNLDYHNRDTKLQGSGTRKETDC